MKPKPRHKVTGSIWFPQKFTYTLYRKNYDEFVHLSNWLENNVSQTLQLRIRNLGFMSRKNNQKINYQCVR